MKFTQYYFTEDEDAYIWSEPLDKYVHIPIITNPTKEQFIKLSRHPLAEINKVKVIRLGINRGEVIAWPGSVFHHAVILYLQEYKFRFNFIYDLSKPTVFYTDWDDNFQEQTGNDDFVTIIRKKLSFLPVTAMISNNTGKLLFDWTMDATDISFDEPEYATSIRNFHSED